MTATVTRRHDRPSGFPLVRSPVFLLALAEPCEHHDAPAGCPCWTDPTTGLCGPRVSAALLALHHPVTRKDRRRA